MRTAVRLFYGQVGPSALVIVVEQEEHVWWERFVQEGKIKISLGRMTITPV